MTVVRIEHRPPIAIVTIDNPPINATAHAVRVGLADAFGALAGDPEIRGVVLQAAGRTFPAGADIAEFGRPPVAPVLRDVLAAIEAQDKPVVALVHGTALGGGLELALACHARLLDPAAEVGLPEVTLGIVPGAGGTQRLPRLTGLAAALDLITTGRRIGAAEALRLGIADAVTEGDRLGFACDWLLARLDAPVRRTSDLPVPPLDEAMLAAARAVAARRMPGQVAPGRAVEAVAAGGAGFAAGMAAEAAIFAELRDGPQARALRHVFFAEREAAKIPETAMAEARPVDRVGVVGGGTMGAGIAAAALLAGLPVTMMERDAAAASAGRDRVAAILDESAKRGRLSPERRAAILDDAFATTIEADDLGDADLVVEAAFEDMDVKRALFARIASAVRPEAVLATNTSYLDVRAIAAAAARPERVIGLHFFSPAHVMKLVEVVVPDGAAPAAVATGVALARRLSKVPVRTGVCDGFIGNRILSAYRKAMEFAVEDGAAPEEVDAAMRGFGWPMGVFEMQDLAGLDIGHANRRRLDATRDPRERYVRIADRLVAAGRLGRKTGAGFYRYEEGRAVSDPAVAAIVVEERAARGIAPRAIPAEEIVIRLRAAIANEAARLLAEGIALRASDVDVVMILGYGYPRWRGGPLHEAAAYGLDRVVADLRRLAAEDPFFWTPSDAMIEAARRGAWV